MILIVLLQRFQLGVRESGEERVLKRVAVLYLELIEHHLARRAVLVVLHVECAVVELEEGVTLAQHTWNDAQEGVVLHVSLRRPVAWLVVGAAVSETAHGLKVAVDVAKDVDLSFLFDHPGHELACIHDGVQPGRWVEPTAIHVEASEVGAVVALDNTVGVKHRHNIENVLASQILRFLVV